MLIRAGSNESKALICSPGPDVLTLDAGNGAECFELSTDQRGTGRSLDGNGDGLAVCDIGSSELYPNQIFFSGFESILK